jgi:hypothetical protein
MQVEGEPSDWTITFRTMGGNVAAVLKWSSEHPTHELPEQVFHGMKTAGFQLPSRHLRASNLRFILHGKILDCKSDCLAQELGLESVESGPENRPTKRFRSRSLGSDQD